MAARHDERTRNLIETLERAITLADVGEHGDVVTLLEATMEELLIEPLRAPADALSSTYGLLVR